jgi:hypothetical protein
MPWHSLRKAPDKNNKRIVSLRVPFSIRISNRVHRRAVFVTVCIIMAAILGTIMENSRSSKTVAHGDSVRGLGVGIYWDQGCANRTLSLDWGLIEPGSNNTLTVYIRNEGKSAVSLWITTSNWNPSAALGYMSLDWNYSGQILGVDQVIHLELILSVFPTVSEIQHFSFDIIITTTS